MDIYCSICGEPWDLGELHDVMSPGGGRKLTFKEAKDQFYQIGCNALGAKHNTVTAVVDAKCPKCGESSYVDGSDAGYRICNGCGNNWKVETQAPRILRPFRAQLADAMQDILGDDVDGLAAMMEDAEYAMGDEFWEDGE